MQNILSITKSIVPYPGDATTSCAASSRQCFSTHFALYRHARYGSDEDGEAPAENQRTAPESAGHDGRSGANSPAKLTF